MRAYVCVFVCACLYVCACASRIMYMYYVSAHEKYEILYFGIVFILNKGSYVHYSEIEYLVIHSNQDTLTGPKGGRIRGSPTVHTYIHACTSMV